MFAELAAAAASALAGAVATDAWVWVKTSVRSLFTRAGTAEQAVDNWLDATEREVLGTSDPAMIGRVESRWSSRWEVLLDTNPELEAELADFVDRLSGSGAPSQGAVFQRATVNDQGQQAVLGHGTQTNTFHARG